MESEQKKRFWISWYSPLEPENIPYPCWITGERGWSDEDDDFAFTYVADIHTISEDAAFEIVEELFPNYEYRFCNEIALDWQPSDRFQ